MEKTGNIPHKELWLLYLSLNLLFIWKYMSRTPYHPILGIGVFITILIGLLYIYKNIENHKKLLKIFSFSILTISVILIGIILYKIDPLCVNVDRWSATSYFLDGLFSGQYPYGIHTHVCETNYPSPSPLWFYINIPFWLMSDVGIGLIFYLLLLVAIVFWYTHSNRQTFLFMTLLLISPAYWWEVIVRSDGFSNTIIIFCIILWFEKKNISFQKHWIVTSIICGMIAVTRLWAPIAPAIYLAKSFFKVSNLRKILIILIILLVMFFFFFPYIFWDTQNWIFFHRNPYMSETSTGNGWILLIMIVLALFLSLRYKDFYQYCKYTSIFFTLFFIISLVFNHVVYHSNISFFEDANFDISYLSLMLPYCLLVISKSLTIDVIKK